MIGQPSNPLLAKAEQALQAKVPANLQDSLDHIVQSGNKILYSPALRSQLQQKIASSNDPINDAGQGAARVLGQLFQQSKQTLPKQLVVPAAMMLAFEYIDLVAQAGKVQITPDVIAQVTQSVGSNILAPLGVTPQKVQQLQQMAVQKQQAPQGILAGAQGGQ